MKKIFGLVMTFVLLAGAALPAAAQTTRRGAYASRAAQQRAYERRQREYYDDRYDDPSVFEKHRDKLTVAGGTAAGAAVGAVTGGKKGAIIGALVGAGASALYTYKLRDKTEDGRRWRR